MNTRKAAPAIAVLSLVALMTGCAGGVAGAGDGGQVRDDLSPAANAAIGLARGHVIVRDDLSPLNPVNPTSTQQPDLVDDDLSPLRGSR